jgi:hypothetical protein
VNYISFQYVISRTFAIVYILVVLFSDSSIKAPPTTILDDI